MVDQCPTSPDTTGAAEAGRLAHEYAAGMLRAHLSGVAYTMPEGADLDLWSCAEEYADEVVKIHKTGGGKLLVEHEVAAPSVHPDSRGTLDAAIIGDGILRVFDFKSGHRHVSPFENWQLINYTAGLLDEHPEIVDTEIAVVLHIVQPLSYSGQDNYWVLKQGSQLRPYINALAIGAREASEPNAPCHAGTHCRYCPARHVCEACVEAGLGMADSVGVSVVEDLTVAQMAHRLDLVRSAIEHLKYLDTGLTEELLAAARSGKPVPGYVVKDKYSRETWLCATHEVIAIGETLGIDLRKPDTITPNQARKKGVPEELIKDFAGRKPAGFELVKDTNTQARRVFV